MKTINLIVVRHGKTYFNRYNKLQDGETRH